MARWMNAVLTSCPGRLSALSRLSKICATQVAGLAAATQGPADRILASARMRYGDSQKEILQLLSELRWYSGYGVCYGIMEYFALSFC